MHRCFTCKNQMTVQKLHCTACDVSHEGDFKTPRLTRLSAHNRRLAEAFLLTGGNLKDLAEKIGVSYPTLRRQVDEMIDELSRLQNEDEQETTRILDAIEKGEMPPEKGMRFIKEINGEY